MANLEFNRQDIENLAQRLASLWDQFSPQERALLRAIFANAAGKVSPPGPGQPATLPAATDSAQALAAGANYAATLAHYQQQLLTAYIAGNSFDSVTASGDTGKII